MTALLEEERIYLLENASSNDPEDIPVLVGNGSNKNRSTTKQHYSIPKNNYFHPIFFIE